MQGQHLPETAKDDLARFLASIAASEPDLALVVKRWPGLPENIKAAIKMLVEAD